MHVEIEVIEKQLADCKERASISDRALTSTQELQSAKMECKALEAKLGSAH